MGLKINGSTSGSIEIDVPAVAGTDTAITIPATTGGEFIVSDSSGNVDLGALDISGSASADSVVIDSSGRVGIGTSSPGSFDVQGDNLVVGSGSGHNGISIYSGTTSNGNIYFADGTSGVEKYRGIVGYDHNSDVMFFHSAAAERMRITSGSSGGLILVGRSTAVSANATLGIDTASGVAGIISETGPTSFIDHIRFFNGNGNVGNITTNGSATAYNTSSDYRLKENIVDIADGITRVKQLQPRRFNFIADDTTTVDGFIAHEAQDVVPEAITGEKDAVDDEGNPVYQGIDQSKLVPLLTAALQEAIAKIETLETANASLEARLTALEGGAS